MADVSYSFGAIKMCGYFAAPAGTETKHPGVLIVPDAFGLGTHYIGIADRLAALGFAAFAVDLWGERRQFSDLPTVMGAMQDLIDDRASWMGRVEAAREALARQDGVDGTKIAAIGYCLGGGTVLEFARTGGVLKGVISFHGGLDPVGTAWDASKVSAKLLVCTGAEDPLIPWAAVTALQDNLRKGGVDWELDVYSRTKHSFTRPDASLAGTDWSAYDAQADRRSWRAMLDFFGEIFADDAQQSAVL